MYEEWSLLHSYYGQFLRDIHKRGSYLVKVVYLESNQVKRDSNKEIHSLKWTENRIMRNLCSTYSQFSLQIIVGSIFLKIICALVDNPL